MNNEPILLTIFHKANMIIAEKVDAYRLQDKILAVNLHTIFVKGTPHTFGVPLQRVRVALDELEGINKICQKNH